MDAQPSEKDFLSLLQVPSKENHTEILYIKRRSRNPTSISIKFRFSYISGSEINDLLKSTYKFWQMKILH